MFDTIMLFVFGLVLLIKGGDWFVDSASNIARRFHVPEILIGATIVSIGTTLPEVMVSAGSALEGNGGLAYGNAIGSIICNTALIAALTIAIRSQQVDRKTFTMPVIFFFIAAIIYMISAYVFGKFTLTIGIILLSLFVIYMVFTVVNAFKIGKREQKTDLEIDETEVETGKKGNGRGEIAKDVVLLIVGAALIALGSRLLVDNGIKIAEWLKVPSSVIGLTFVAIGTSLPELVTAITALVKKHGALSLGNIIGANLFNLVLVSGVSIVISPFSVPVGNTIMGINSTLILDLPIMLLVMMLLTLPPIIRGKISRWQGFVLLAIYAAFFAVQFIL